MIKMNRIIISGFLCKDVELKTTQNNVSVLTNTIAVRKDFKKEDGTYDSDFINVVAYRNNADYISKYFNKGGKVLISGRLNTRNYEDKDNKKVYVTEVVIETIESLTSKQVVTREETKEEQNDPFAEFGEQMSLDDNFLE